MNINERFNSIIQTLFSGNKRAFSTAIGVSPSVVENIVGKRMGKPSFEVLEKVCAIANINVNWLVKGEGEMLLSSTSTNNIDINKPQETLNLPTNGNEGIPLVPIEAIAGIFGGEQNVLLSECTRFFVPIFSEADYLIPIKGDSMYPNYNSGDIVACKKTSPQSSFFQWGKVYVVDTEQGVLIKRLFEGESKHTIKLVSDNPNYPPIEIPREEVYHIALVLGTLRTE